MFKVKTTKSSDRNKLTLKKDGKYDFIGRSNVDNGIQGKIDKLYYEPNPRGTFSLVQVGESVCLYRENEWYASQNIFILIPLYKQFLKSHQFVSSCINKALWYYKDAYVYPTLDEVKYIKVYFPVQNKKIDFDFMESFIAEIEAQHIAELEVQSIVELEAYLSVTGLKEYTLTDEEEKVLEDFDNWHWNKYNLEDLFGKSTRGKRLKSADRVKGDLPFVTAGEALEGISAYISNDVEVFDPNTTTIDMFGSAKYRNYKYGADDHVAVVHTESLPKLASIFTTTAIHKSAHSGEFSYSRNFYAKDADKLYISLPVVNGKPDYKGMETLISAVQKLVIKDIVLYSKNKIEVTKNVIE